MSFVSVPMRPEKSPLDLNNLPEEYLREENQVHDEETSTIGFRRKKSGGKDRKDECGKVYECRFCSHKFCKSQALGGHMNRHRQEKVTEMLNQARQLVFRNETLARGVPHLGLRDLQMGSYQQISSGSFHQSGNMGEPSLPLRSVYSTRLIPGSSSAILSTPQPPQGYHYSSTSGAVSFPSQYPHYPTNDSVVSNFHRQLNQDYVELAKSSCTDGTPLVHALPSGDGSVCISIREREEGLNWGRSYEAGTQESLNPYLINRFQDGF